MSHLNLGRSVATGLAAGLLLWGCGSTTTPPGGGGHDDAGAAGDVTTFEGSNDATTPGVDSGDASPADGRALDASGTLDSIADVTDGSSDVGDAAPAADGSDGGSDAGDAATSVTFAIDMHLGPARQFQPPSQPATIASTIYGINTAGRFGTGNFLQQKTRWGLIRKSSDPFTVWNWTDNYANQGALGCFSQGQAGGGGALAGALTQDTDSIPAAQAKGGAYLAPVAIVDYVSAAVANDVTGKCPADASDCQGGSVVTAAANPNGLAFAWADGGSVDFVGNAASKGSAFCVCPPAQACDAGCTVSVNPVYQDEFVNYLKTNYASDGGAPIFFELGNEPNYLGGTHPEVWPFTGAPQCSTFSVTYDDVTGRDRQFAAAIKAAWPSAKVFGPAVGQDGIAYAHSYQNDPHYPTPFIDYYLQQMAAAAADGGTSLLDVVDVHYYNQGTSVTTQCAQNPRMFWDPGYTALSATDTDNIDFGYGGVNADFDTNWYPRRMIPRLLAKIAAAYPTSGSAPPLAFGEYNSGCEDVVAGAVAEADVLGVFGREGVFAAAAMPLKSLSGNFLVAAFDLYRNYDGNGDTVGDLAVHATTTDDASSSVYAFAHSGGATALELVAINKTTASLPASVSIANAPAVTAATLYNIVGTSAAVVAVGGAPPVVACTSGTCTLTYTMPPMSATTMILR